MSGFVSDPCAGERAAIREVAGIGENHHVPVRVVPGASAPRVDGDAWRFETRTGIPIRHPGSYAKKGRSSMVYVPDSREVLVGELWLLGWRLQGGVFDRPAHVPGEAIEKGRAFLLAVDYSDVPPAIADAEEAFR